MEKRFRITVDGRQYDVTVEDLSEGSSMLIPEPGDMQVPVPKPIAPPPAAPAPAAAPTPGAAEPGDEVSPLAGVVVSVDVTVGQAVNESDKIVTLEAMKMKTVITAHRSGKVTNIAVKAGDAVDAGQVLLTIG
jgi:biotin carboxyl carrier protein